MASKRVKFTFTRKLIPEPVIYTLGHKFDIVTSIRRADIRDGMGWVVLELTGDEDQIANGLDWVAEVGVRVDPVSGDVVEG